MNSGVEGDLSGFSMRELFQEEARNQAAVLTQGLLDLEGKPEYSENLEVLMRASHSMKGAARIVGADLVVGISHLMEDCFVAAQKSKNLLGSKQVDILLKAVDFIIHLSQLEGNQLEEFVSDNSSKTEFLNHSLTELIHFFGEKPVERHPKKGTQTQTLNQQSARKNAEKQSDVNDHEKMTETAIRVSAERLTRIIGLSSEIKIESNWIKPFSTSMLQLKRKHVQLSELLGLLRDSLTKIETEELRTNYLQEAQNKLNECRTLISTKLSELDEFDRRSTNLSTKMHNEALASRMRPFADGVQGFKRMVRDLSKSLKKEIQLKIQGIDTPVDRDILEKLKSPLTHIIRNSVDHGIESPERRKTLGKDKVGCITMTASLVGGLLSISVEDDGAGVDLETLKQKIVERGMVKANVVEELTESELLEFLFLPEMSTRSDVTEISGRGIGLDVVRDLIQSLRGTVTTINESGVGLKFVLQMPQSLSVISALIVHIGGEPFALPLSRVDRIDKVDIEKISSVEGRQYITFNSDHVGLVSASQVLGLKTRSTRADLLNIVMISDWHSRYGLVVDEFVGQKDLSVQALDYRLGKVQDISSAAITEDGSPILVLDIDDLVRSIESMINDSPRGLLGHGKEVSYSAPVKRVLVIDDSMTVREIERNLLEANHYTVDVAVDGMDGWNAIKRHNYDLIITDVDMPRMDGIELVSLVRQDHHKKSIPIMIVSYKDREEDRQRGMNAGADYYLAKGSFHDETLIEAVVDLIGEAT